MDWELHNANIWVAANVWTFAATLASQGVDLENSFYKALLTNVHLVASVSNVDHLCTIIRATENEIQFYEPCVLDVLCAKNADPEVIAHVADRTCSNDLETLKHLDELGLGDRCGVSIGFPFSHLCGAALGANELLMFVEIIRADPKQALEFIPNVAELILNFRNDHRFLLYAAWPLLRVKDAPKTLAVAALTSYVVLRAARESKVEHGMLVDVASATVEENPEVATVPLLEALLRGYYIFDKENKDNIIDAIRLVEGLLTKEERESAPP